MKITITIKNGKSGEAHDISLDNRQKIATTLQILRENLPGFMKGTEETCQIQSERTSRHLNTEATYEESNIYTGDVLVLL